MKKYDTIKYFNPSDITGMYIAAEPATDNFVAVLRGAQEDVIPGTALVLIIAIIIVDIIIVVIVIVIIIITRPWPAFGRRA